MEHFYILYALLWLLIWGVLYLFRKEYLRAAIPLSLVALVITPLQNFLWFRHDYWHTRPLDLELVIADAIFGFAASGIALSAFHLVFSQKPETPRPKATLLVVALAILEVAVTGLLVLRLNSIYASIIALGSVLLVVFFLRRDIWLPAITSATLMVLLMVGTYRVFLWVWPDLFLRFWMLKNLSGTMFLSMPLEEYLWFAAAGAASVALFCFWRGAKIRL